MHAFYFYLTAGAWAEEIYDVKTGGYVSSPEKLAEALRQTKIVQTLAPGAKLMLRYRANQLDVRPLVGGRLLEASKLWPLKHERIDDWAKLCWQAALNNEHAGLGYQCVVCTPPEEREAAIQCNQGLAGSVA